METPEVQGCIRASGVPAASRRARACSNSAAIFAKISSPVQTYNGLSITEAMDEISGCISGNGPFARDTRVVYGWLIGNWDLDIEHYRGEVAAQNMKGEAHFAWVLEGRAVQDVWILPGLYGTILRVWDAVLPAWRVGWVNPVTGSRDDVVQVGRHSDGTPIRRIFSEITGESFRWTGEVFNPDGRTWTLEAEFLAKRR